MSNLLSLIGRERPLFSQDIETFRTELDSQVQRSRFLVIGGAGSIGQAVTKEIFARHPKKLHVVDISENNMVELVRDIRSSLGYIAGDVSVEMMILAKEEYDQEKIVSFVNFDGLAIPFMDNIIETVICLRLFQRIPEEIRQKMLSEFYRIARYNLIISYSYSSVFQCFRNKLKKIYDPKGPVFFQERQKDIFDEVEGAGFRVVAKKHVLFGLSSEIVIYAQK